MLKELLYQRTSIRSFTNKQIKKADLEIILEAGRLSPSSGNEQPWVFGVINDKSTIKKIAECAYKQKYIGSAPLVIALCSINDTESSETKEVQKTKFPSLSEQIEAVDTSVFEAIHENEHQTKIPGTHMVLQALELGIVSTWVSYFDAEAINRLLSLPSNIHVTELLVMGYPVASTKPRNKKSLQEVVFYNNYKGV